MSVQAENICFENMGFAPYPICSTQDCFMASGLGVEDGLSFQQLQYLDHLPSSSSTSFSCYASLPVDILHSLSSDLEKQRLEMDWFLQLENKRLRRLILHEETRLQAFIMQRYESRITSLMQQKDEELAIAINKTRELQDSLKGAEMEARAWQKNATEKEAIVSDLNYRLNQVKQRDCLFPNPAQEDDAMSFCDSSSGNYKGGEKREDPNKKMGCKLCQARRLCVVFFPCRHLCCCKSCESLLGQCPVCATVKEASLEVFLV